MDSQDGLKGSNVVLLSVFSVLAVVGVCANLVFLAFKEPQTDRLYEDLGKQEKVLVDFLEGREVVREDVWWLYAQPAWISSMTKRICRGLGIENSTQIECLLTDPNNQVLRYTGEPLSFEELRKK